MSESLPVDNLEHIQLVVCPIHSKAEEEACIPLVHNLQEKSSCSQLKEKNTTGKNDRQKNLILQKKSLVNNLQKKIPLLNNLQKIAFYTNFAKEYLLYTIYGFQVTPHNLL